MSARAVPSIAMVPWAVVTVVVKEARRPDARSTVTLAVSGSPTCAGVWTVDV